MQVMERNVALGDAADDLPRTLRREREARDRAQGGAALNATKPAQGFVPEATAWADQSAPQPATVTAIDVSFFRLMLFCFKLVFAALPAILLLGAILWTIGHLLMTYYPWLVKMQILIRVPN